MTTDEQIVVLKDDLGRLVIDGFRLASCIAQLLDRCKGIETTLEEVKKEGNS